jgi:hypothetical protein
MPNLEILDCSFTQIKNLSNMSNLKELYCNSTSLINLPNMYILKKLYCYDTQIIYFPYMPKLEELFCGTMIMNVYKKQLKIIKNMLILASLQMIASKSVLSTIDINGFNIARLVRNFLRN